MSEAFTGARTTGAQRPPVRSEQNGWVSKDEAARLLGVLPRQVEKRAQSGWLDKRTLPRKPNERSARVEYSKSDIKALLAGTPNQYGEAMSSPASHTLPPAAGNGVVRTNAAGREPAPLLSPMAMQGMAWGALAEHLAKLSAAFPAPKRDWPAWLTMEQAVEYCGLQYTEVERLVREGLIYSLGRGPKTWRVQRASLDAFGKAGHQ